MTAPPTPSSSRTSVRAATFTNRSAHQPQQDPQAGERTRLASWCGDSPQERSNLRGLLPTFLPQRLGKSSRSTNSGQMLPGFFQRHRTHGPSVPPAPDGAQARRIFFHLRVLAPLREPLRNLDSERKKAEFTQRRAGAKTDRPGHQRRDACTHSRPFAVQNSNPRTFQ